ncbi:TPA: leucyl aminopeptidase [Candidatus Uhrbacteria bacterium]|uniref:Probable cytosol aminopeptidase n=2 Tax=Candidatus Uhriibacteriota TaxID=1752732 RepID=A0A0G1Q7Y9_9BACT|nr:MAG: putative cytosol aminopeptidase [Candidatus Uhrbacteria bacterium GW2011_GWF2_46_218]KKU40972.1 MAG: putative cytosol aminopeptidase [Candidatus Uhrbacteria bacterium GW2011_GWE2_46_68]HBK33670.1 leucyl aminopeptidase [Candidatus Uhrbacteria bacterium]HCB18931.1 leucyl aminopeptidase [Candidatus Uhrbacteria bacterium]
MLSIPVLEELPTKTDLRITFLDEKFIRRELQKKQSSEIPADLFHFEQMTGVLGQCVWEDHPSLRSRRALYVGLGSTLTLEDYRQAAATARMALKPWSLRSVILTFPPVIPKRLSVSEVAQAITEGWVLASYHFDRYKKKTKYKEPRLSFLVADKRGHAPVVRGIEKGLLFVQATSLARDLVNTPAAFNTPKDLMESARAIAQAHSSISFKMFDETKLKRMKAGGILAIGQGSMHPPFLVHLIYKPKKKAVKKIALVGKAVTFDSGGLSLKPADAMMSMKCDMAGAATVLGIFSVLEELQVPFEVHGIFAACENMPSGHAIRPGDIIKTLNGTTIEIANTDAEGRVTLADSLAYATKFSPDVLMDFATLTGACLVALGEEIAGVLSTTGNWKKRFLQAAETTGEKMWELPLEKKYEKLLESDVADLRNISGSKYGGVLTAGLFLQHFVGKTPWIHVDIAGPAFAEKMFEPYIQKGGTGFGVRSCLRLLLS